MTIYQKLSNRILLKLIFFAALCILFSCVLVLTRLGGYWNGSA